MNNLLDSLLLLQNNICVEIDFKAKIALRVLKSNHVIAENITLTEFTQLLCDIEDLNQKTQDKLNLFFTNLLPSEEPFSLIVSFEKKSKDSNKSVFKYEVKGILKNEILTMTFSMLNQDNADSLDSVTKVYTRAAIIEKTKQQIEEKKPFALLILDIDNFKQFNDTYGHMFGDIILVEAAGIIKKALCPNDYIGRIGGDEFLIIIHTPNNSFEEIHKVCGKIKKAIQELSNNNIKQASITATIGCSVYPKDGMDYEQLFKKADTALYRGKRKGRNCFIIYTIEKCGEVDDSSLKERFTDIEYIDKNASNSQVIVAVYEILVRKNSFKKNLKDIMALVCNFFLIDRIHMSINQLQNEKNVHIEWIDSQLKGYENLIQPLLKDRGLWIEQLDHTGMIKLNQVKAQQQDLPLMKLLLEQKTKSILGFQMKIMDKDIGFIRFDTITHNKFWQAPDVSALMVIAKIIAITINKLNEDSKPLLALN